MSHLVAQVPVYEYEREWGSRLDDYMLCLSMSDAADFITKFNSNNTEPTAPDYYMIARNPAQPVDVTDEVYQQILASENQRIWKSELSD